MPHNRDGRWSRRKLLGTAGLGLGAGVLHGSGARLWAAEARAACTLTPELEIGPYYLPYELLRSDIREGKPGVPLELVVELRDAKTCRPLVNAAVDVWHCDALGVYSGFTGVDASRMGPPPERPDGRNPPRGIDDRRAPPPGPPEGPPPLGDGGPPPMRQTDQQTFLRGVQLTGTEGTVRFHTIYPGWYVGRDTHIHIEVHLGGVPQANAAHAADAAHTAYGRYAGGHVCHTGQISFPDDLSDRIGRLEPYRQHTIERTRLAEDMVFHDDGKAVMLDIRPRLPAHLEAGFIGRSIVFVDPGATPAPVGPGGPPGGFGSPPRRTS